MLVGGMYCVEGLPSSAIGEVGGAAGGGAAGFDSTAGILAVAPTAPNSSAPGTLNEGRWAAIMSRSCCALMATVPDSVRGDGAGGAAGAAGFGAGAGAGAAAAGATGAGCGAGRGCGGAAACGGGAACGGAAARTVAPPTT